jgi:hypothetical protein
LEKMKALQTIFMTTGFAYVTAFKTRNFVFARVTH